VEPVRVLEEALGGHGEELARPLGRVVVEGHEPPLVERLLEADAALADPPDPRPPRRRRLQRRHAVDVAVEHVDGVRAFVDDDTPRPVPQPSPLHHPRPGEHHAAPLPGLAESRLAPFELAAAGQRRGAGHDVVARVDEHRREPVEVLLRHAEHHDARLARDRHPHLVVDPLPAAALEPLLRDEHGHPRPQPPPFVVVEPGGLLHVAAEDVVPLRGPGTGADRPAASGSQPAEHEGHPAPVAVRA